MVDQFVNRMFITKYKITEWQNRSEIATFPSEAVALIQPLSCISPHTQFNATDNAILSSFLLSLSRKRQHHPASTDCDRNAGATGIM